MSKKKELNKSEVEKRKARVSSCVQCKGAPPTKRCNLQGLVFDICNECDEIVGDYHKEGQAITIEKKVAIPANINDPNYSNFHNPLEVKMDTIPGKPGFSNLEIK